MEKLSGCGNNGIAQVECSQTFRKKQRLKIEIPIGNKSLQRGRSELITDRHIRLQRFREGFQATATAKSREYAYD
ncbi:MAG: hypothetical protein ACI89J_002851 [Hyphomicrobiaceae bacterium]|jgi:hypothetical protein